MRRLCFLTAALASILISTPGYAAEEQDGEIIVSIAASTKDVIETLAADFMKQGGKVNINPGSSSGLAGQILAGAPADLFLSANRQWATKVGEAKLAEESKELLTNKLVIVVPKGNPAKVKEPKDLVGDAVKKIAMAGEKVPTGQYGDQALAKLGLIKELAKQGKIARAQDVRGALVFVERREAEAGIVYSTDVNVAAGVETVYEFDPSLHDEIVYVLVLLKHGKDNPLARQFFKYLQSDAATAVYTKAGFSRAPTKAP